MLSCFIIIDGFQEATSGNRCENREKLHQVQTLERCKEAHEWLQRELPSYKGSKFIDAAGNGSDLPYGCISDKVSDNHYVYWNTDGNVISADSNLRLICEKLPGG